MIRGAIVNATAFIWGKAIAKKVSRSRTNEMLAKNKRHNKALKAYQAAYDKYMREPTQLENWIEKNAELQDQAKQDFTKTAYAFKLYNRTHPDRQLTPRKPKFSDFYQPSAAKK